MRIEIISVILAQISVPVSSGFGTLISADETLIKSNHEKAHGFMKAEVSHQFWPQRNAGMEAAHSFGVDRASGMRFEIISVSLAQISVPVSSVFGTLISADETLIKTKTIMKNYTTL